MNYQSDLIGSGWFLSVLRFFNIFVIEQGLSADGPTPPGPQGGGGGGPHGSGGPAPQPPGPITAVGITAVEIGLRI